MTSLISRSLWLWVPVLAASLPVGCLVDENLGDTETETGVGSTGPTSSTSNGPGGDPSSATSTSGSNDDDSTSGSGSSDSTGEPTFVCPPEEGQPPCDLLAQDCGPGLRCIPYGLGVSGTVTPVCVPAVDDPLPSYAICTVDPEGCTDPCGVGEYCLPTDASDSGICVGLCDASGDDATCGGGEICDTCAECTVGLCWAGCDPLAPDCPGSGNTCVYESSEEAFECLPIQSMRLGLGQMCTDAYSCAQGLACVTEEVLDGCDGLGACCTELCDLADGDPGCSDAAHVCFPFVWPGPAAAGQEHVGVCGLPEFDPCAIPGNCAPDGIDDSIPWCSLTNESACPELVPAGLFDGINCEQTCTCGLPCQDPGQCPVPATGTATAACVIEPDGPGSPNTCLYSCAAGEVCPDGMTCTDSLYGEPYCLWVSPADPADCL